MLTQIDFFIERKINPMDKKAYLYILDKLSHSTAVCVFPSGKTIIKAIFKYTGITEKQLRKIIENKDKFELNKSYDFETLLK